MDRVRRYIYIYILYIYYILYKVVRVVCKVFYTSLADFLSYLVIMCCSLIFFAKVSLLTKCTHAIYTKIRGSVPKCATFEDYGKEILPILPFLSGCR